MDKKDEQIKKLKKALKIYAKRLKSTEGKIYHCLLVIVLTDTKHTIIVSS